LSSLGPFASLEEAQLIRRGGVIGCPVECPHHQPLDGDRRAQQQPREQRERLAERRQTARSPIHREASVLRSAARPPLLMRGPWALRPRLAAGLPLSWKSHPTPTPDAPKRPGAGSLIHQTAWKGRSRKFDDELRKWAFRAMPFRRRLPRVCRTRARHTSGKERGGGPRETDELGVRPPLPHRRREGRGRQACQVPGLRVQRPRAGRRRAGDAGASGGGAVRAEAGGLTSSTPRSPRANEHTKPPIHPTS
jgi:hypothetical protein